MAQGDIGKNSEFLTQKILKRSLFLLLLSALPVRHWRSLKFKSRVTLYQKFDATRSNICVKKFILVSKTAQGFYYAALLLHHYAATLQSEQCCEHSYNTQSSYPPYIAASNSLDILLVPTHQYSICLGYVALTYAAVFLTDETLSLPKLTSSLRVYSYFMATASQQSMWMC